MERDRSARAGCVGVEEGPQGVQDGSICPEPALDVAGSGLEGDLQGDAVHTANTQATEPVSSLELAHRRLYTTTDSIALSPVLRALL